MGRSRGGLTRKIHALVDTNGLPIRLALTAGEAHDNRLAGKLVSRLKSGTMLLADRVMTLTGSGPSPPRVAFGPTSREEMRRTLTRTSAPILSSLRRMVPQVALANLVSQSPIRRVAHSRT